MYMTPMLFTSLYDVLNHIHADDPVCLASAIHLYFRVGSGMYVSNKACFSFVNPYLLNDWAHTIPFEQQPNLLKYLAAHLYKQECSPILSACRVNGYLIRGEYPHVYHGDRDGIYLQWASQLVRDGYVFINRKDFPCVYTNMLTRMSVPPILSVSKAEGFRDGWCPNHEEIMLLSTFPQSRVPYADKTPMVCFRGTYTGYGLSPYDNYRLAVCMSNVLQDTNKFDVGLIQKPTRVRWHTHRPALICPKLPEYTQYKPRLEMKEMCTYRFVLVLPGHVHPFRLLQLLYHGCIVLWVVDKFTPWYMNQLVAGTHYIALPNTTPATGIVPLLERFNIDADYSDMSRAAMEVAECILTRMNEQWVKQVRQPTLTPRTVLSIPDTLPYALKDTRDYLPWERWVHMHHTDTVFELFRHVVKRIYLQQVHHRFMYPTGSSNHVWVHSSYTGGIVSDMDVMFMYPEQIEVIMDVDVHELHWHHQVRWIYPILCPVLVSHTSNHWLPLVSLLSKTCPRTWGGYVFQTTTSEYTPSNRGGTQLEYDHVLHVSTHAKHMTMDHRYRPIWGEECPLHRIAKFLFPQDTYATLNPMEIIE